MKKKILLLILLLFVKGQFTDRANIGLLEVYNNHIIQNNIIKELYQSLSPEQNRPSYESFFNALTGYLQLNQKGEIKNLRYLTIVDYSLSSANKRLWVVDLHYNLIVFNTLVAHGKNSGEEFATYFSDKPKSNMSSLGFFLTDETYIGKHGLSLILDGLESGINGNARTRAIVIHPADYVSEDYIKKNNRLGRSFGCPALPAEVSADIIQTIKGRSLFFIYSPDKNYLTTSEIIQAS